MATHGRGGRPDPTHLKLVKGNTRSDRVNYQDPSLLLPRLDPNQVEIPATLTRHHAMDRWNYYAPKLAAMGVLTEWDVNALEAMCQAYADTVELRDVIEQEGRFFHQYCDVDGVLVVDPETGKPIPKAIKTHPAVQQYAEADRRMRAHMVELGITPSARSRVKVSAPEKEDDPAERHFS